MRVSVPGMSLDSFRADTSLSSQLLIPALTTLMVVQGHSRGLCGGLLIGK